ncbi:MAG: Rne/Rng family ribonuclease, partial [Planctomycetota bacterium]
GGGISRKITNLSDRKRLKSIAGELDVAEGMGVILRTAGASRTKPEIQRDFEYLLRLWENVRNLTLQSTAPCLVYEEGSLIKRSIRDLYNKDTGDIFVSGDAAYNEAKAFMSMLMPSHAKYVKRYTDRVPIFSRNGVEAQLDKMLQPQVTLKSGGYLVINQTEALVAIDVNSGRATKQHSIEDTATQTNLEAAEEVARQLRLRDLAGLVVVDFIDMEEKRNNRAVEKRLKDALKNDRARIQVSRISHFGLLEMSRQRIRASVLESTTQVCPTCEGMGHIRSASSVALHVLRTTEEYLLKASKHNLVVKTSAETAQYVLNSKRDNLVDLESRFGVAITIEIDPTIGNQYISIERGEFATPRVKAETHVQPDSFWPDESSGESSANENLDESSDDSSEVVENAETGENEDRPKRKRRRSRRGRGRSNAANGDTPISEETGETEASADAVPTDAAVETAEDDAAPAKRRRRGRRGGRNNTQEENGVSAEAVIDDVKEETTGEADASPSEAEVETPAEAEVVEEKPNRNRRPRRAKKAKPVETIESDVVSKVPESTPDNASEDSPDASGTTDVKAEEVAKTPRRTSRRPRKKKPEDTESNSEAKAVEVEAVAEASTPAETVAGDANASAAEEAPAKPKRNTRRKSSKADSDEPVAASETPKAAEMAIEEPAKEDKKSKKGGWWQRRSFF